VRRAGLAGDRLRAVTDPQVEAAALTAGLASAGFQHTIVQPGDLTMEDVFLSFH